MHTEPKQVKYPENLYLKDEVTKSGRSIQWYADRINVDRQTVSNTINGKYKGNNIVPKLLILIETGALPE